MNAPQLMRGFWEKSEATEMLRDDRLYTGDLGYLDADGYLFIVDRKKDLIKTSGFQVWLREIEEVIAASCRALARRLTSTRSARTASKNSRPTKFPHGSRFGRNCRRR